MFNDQPFIIYIFICFLQVGSIRRRSIFLYAMFSQTAFIIKDIVIIESYYLIIEEIIIN